MTTHIRIVISVFLFFLILFSVMYIAAKLETVNGLALKGKNLAISTEYRRFMSPPDLSAQKAYEHLQVISTSQKPLKQDFGDHTYWHLLTLKNLRTSPGSYVYLFDNPMLDEIDVYQVAGQQVVLLKEIGDTRIGATKKDLALPHIQFEVGGQESVNFLIKTRSLGVPNLPVGLYEAAGFVRYENTLFLLWGALIGVVLVMSAYNLILYLGVKDKLYLLYVGYILSFLLVLSFVHGFAVYLLPISIFALLATKIIPIYYLLGVFLLLFSYYFLRFNSKKTSKITRAVRAFSYVLIALGGFAVFQLEYEAARLFAPMQILIYLLCLAMLVKRLKQNTSWAALYIVSWLPLFVGSAIGTMMLQGELEYSFWTRHAAFIGVALEMALISMALAERLRVNKADILFHATHDKLYNLANIAKLKTVIKDSKRLVNNKYTILLIELDEQTELQSLTDSYRFKVEIEELIAEIQRFFSSYLHILEVDKNAKFNKVSLVREGVFALTVTSSDEALLKTTISEFCKLQQFSNEASDKSFKIHIRIGAATREEKTLTLNQVLSHAQQAINIAKSKKLNYWLFNENDRQNQQRRIELAKALQTAIDEEQLDVYHQPKLCAVSKTVIGSEILVRWEHPEYGPLSPKEFIPIAKDTGLITMLTKWVVDVSCRHLSLINAKINSKYTVSVNISIFDLHLPGFLTLIKNTVSKHAILPSNIIFELTDIKLEHIDDTTLDVISKLKNNGYGISVDGLKAPLSNLSYVYQGFVTELKIDHQSVKNIQGSPGGSTLLGTLTKMSTISGANIVGIGIDSEQAEADMVTLPSNVLQGFSYCEPLPFDVYQNWLKTTEFE